MQETITVLSVAGSDSGAGAGVQADLKTFAALGVYGVTAVTAVTAQNSQGLLGIEEVSPEMIRSQIVAVVDDFKVRVLKTGMLASAGAVRCVAEAIDHCKFQQVVVDPLIRAGSGQQLIEDEAGEALKELLIPRATVLTPNSPEAGFLSGGVVENLEQAHDAARRLHALGADNVVIKGGHLESGPDCTDLLFDGRSFELFRGKRVKTRRDHGTGCTFASALAALLARGRTVPQAVRGAGDYVRAALQGGANSSLGRGRGPLEHFPRTLPDSIR